MTLPDTQLGESSGESPQCNARRQNVTNREATQAAGSSTLRHALRSALLDGFSSARELSARLSVPEKDVAPHLAHLEKSLRQVGGRLEVEPASCIACGFVFKKRERLTKPSGCPVCCSERIEAPRFRALEGSAAPRSERSNSPKKAKSRHVRDAALDDDPDDTWFYEQKFAS